jgi:tetratricopeptide (TPR) repeat protein
MLRVVDDFEDDYLPPRRNGVARLIVTIVVVSALAFCAWVAEKKFHIVQSLEAAFSHGPPAAPPVDPRIGSFLADGERALIADDLETAQSAFDKASVLAGVDARVSLDLSRVAAAKADVAWLDLRILPPDAADAIRVDRATVAERAAAAVHAVQDAINAHPDDPQVITAKIDALRLSGEVDAARGYVVAVFGKVSEPETAYVLAMLEMAQGTPPWSAIVDRLRNAAAGEWSSGRVRAALVLALVKAGDLAGARAEMSKLEALARPYPCLPSLQALVAGPVPAATVTEARDAGADATPTAAHPAKVTASQGSSGEPDDSNAAGALVAANQAMAVHDFSRAEQIYDAILTSQPNDSQALSGLGDIARARGDTQGAIASYRRAVAVNPSYLPALLGLADTQWFGGDKGAAVSGYKNIQDHFPDGTYPEYVHSRAGGSQ